MRPTAALLATIAILLCEVAGRAEVRVEQVQFEGWQGAYRLSNGVVDLVFVPQIGRIMRFGYVGGANLLWNRPEMRGRVTDFSRPVTEWNNYGGDKLWPSPQSAWTWPPDPALESSPQAVRVADDNHLIVTSQPSSQYGIRFQRDIALAETGATATVRNTMMNVSDRPVHWGIWEVTQLDAPAGVTIPLNSKGRFPQGYYVFPGSPPADGTLTVTGRQVAFRRDATRSAKIGGDSPAGWITGETHGVRLRIMASVERGADYPDNGCAQEVWSNAGADAYMEMEQMAPVRTLAPGASAVFVTNWRLTAAPRG